MDGRLRTLADVDAIYGDALYEASSNSADSVRSAGGKHSPIVIATIVIALGWTLLVIRTESFDFSAVTAASQHVQIAQEQAALAEDAATTAVDPANLQDANEAAATAKCGCRRGVGCAACYSASCRREHAGARRRQRHRRRRSARRRLIPADARRRGGSGGHECCGRQAQQAAHVGVRGRTTIAFGWHLRSW
jgi:hypothetical protein